MSGTRFPDTQTVNWHACLGKTCRVSRTHRTKRRLIQRTMSTIKWNVNANAPLIYSNISLFATRLYYNGSACKNLLFPESFPQQTTIISHMTQHMFITQVKSLFLLISCVGTEPFGLCAHSSGFSHGALQTDRFFF